MSEAVGVTAFHARKLARNHDAAAGMDQRSRPIA